MKRALGSLGAGMAVLGFIVALGVLLMVLSAYVGGPVSLR